MNKLKTYNIFLFLSTLTRGLVEVFSLVLLYKKGYSLNNILLFLFILYGVGMIVNYLSLKFYYKYVLVLSSIIYGLSFIYLSNMNSGLIPLSIFGILLSFGNYSYHAIRHYLALVMLKNKRRNTTNLVMISYIGTIVASLIGMYLIEKLNILVTSITIFTLSFISLIPIFLHPKIELSKINNNTKLFIPKQKILFNIFEQFKVIFLELQPLFLYIYIDSSIYYVGIFNVIINVASLIVVYCLSKKLKLKYFKYYCLILCLIFILKLNIKSGILLLLLAFFEGIFTKIYESFSLNNLYNYDNNYIPKYLLAEELIFFGTKTIIILIYLLLRLDIYIIMYINITGIIISGFFLKEKRNT